MGTDTTGSFDGRAGGVPPVEAFYVLDRLRVDIDRRLASLAPEEPAAHEAWQELQTVVMRLRAAVRGLASAPAAGLAELQAKAAILAALLRSEVGGGGQVIADAERIALTLSLTDDIAILTNS
jgi:hypothetical protein